MRARSALCSLSPSPRRRIGLFHVGYADDVRAIGGVAAARYLDRILKGARPSDLPVEEISEFELTVNLRTAKALAIAVPRPILLRANRLIE